MELNEKLTTMTRPKLFPLIVSAICRSDPKVRDVNILNANIVLATPLPSTSRTPQWTNTTITAVVKKTDIPQQIKIGLHLVDSIHQLPSFLSQDLELRARNLEIWFPLIPLTIMHE